METSWIKHNRRLIESIIAIHFMKLRSIVEILLFDTPFLLTHIFSQTLHFAFSHATYITLFHFDKIRSTIRVDFLIFPIKIYDYLDKIGHFDDGDTTKGNASNDK